MNICKKILSTIILSATFLCCAFNVAQTKDQFYQIGKASYYSYEFNKRKTASGEKFNPKSLIAAHRTLPFGTMLKVTNLSNNRSVVVKVADRGPHVKNRILDLSYGAATKIGIVKKGIGNVSIEILNNENLENS